MDSCDLIAALRTLVREASARTPATLGPAYSRAPAVADVMGGIGEEGGSLVLTATLPKAVAAAAWLTGGSGVRVIGSGPAGRREVEIPAEAVNGGAADPVRLIAACRESDAEWAAPAILAAAQTIHATVVPKIEQGLFIALHTDLPDEADFGRMAVTAAAVTDALCRLHTAGLDRIAKARIGDEAIRAISPTRSLRIVMTALAGRSGGALIQTRFAPQIGCDVLEMPAGITIVSAKTRLARPTTTARLRETSLCAEMGRAMITELHRGDGLLREGMDIRLSSITPNEYVERFRDRLPTKITAKAYEQRYGVLRGLNGAADGKSIFKIRSRSEHIIYENKRVQDFVSAILKARRGEAAWLEKAGELMYASHWSHSQRCGIGGVETDQFVNCIRKQGPAAGLFGAKVTGGGEGGELVVLMRDDDRARAALATALAEARSLSQQPVDAFPGSLPGAEYFDAAEPEAGGARQTVVATAAPTTAAPAMRTPAAQPV